jgi:hypothetical protein
VFHVRRELFEEAHPPQWNEPWRVLFERFLVFLGHFFRSSGPLLTALALVAAAAANDKVTSIPYLLLGLAMLARGVSVPALVYPTPSLVCRLWPAAVLFQLAAVLAQFAAQLAQRWPFAAPGAPPIVILGSLSEATRRYLTVSARAEGRATMARYYLPDLVALALSFLLWNAMAVQRRRRTDRGVSSIYNAPDASLFDPRSRTALHDAAVDSHHDDRSAAMSTTTGAANSPVVTVHGQLVTRDANGVPSPPPPLVHLPPLVLPPLLLLLVLAASLGSFTLLSMGYFAWGLWALVHGVVPEAPRGSSAAATLAAAPPAAGAQTGTGPESKISSDKPAAAADTLPEPTGAVGRVRGTDLRERWRLLRWYNAAVLVASIVYQLPFWDGESCTVPPGGFSVRGVIGLCKFGTDGGLSRHGVLASLAILAMVSLARRLLRPRVLRPAAAYLAASDAAARKAYAREVEWLCNVEEVKRQRVRDGGRYGVVY